MPARTLILVLTLLGHTAVAHADDRTAPSQAAVAAFAEGKRLLTAGKDARPAFAQAMRAFQELSGSRLETPGECQNFGNAAYLADELPLAILAYRVGLMLDPHQPVLRKNLEHARAQVQYPPSHEGRTEPDFWPAWMPRASATTWLRVAVTFYCLACLSGAAWFLRRRAGLLGTALFCLAGAVVAGNGWRVLHRQWEREWSLPPVVIRGDDVPLYTGNGPSYPRHPELPSLQRGMEARRLRERGGWLLVEFATGETGWILESQAWTIKVQGDGGAAVVIGRPAASAAIDTRLDCKPPSRHRQV